MASNQWTRREFVERAGKTVGGAVLTVGIVDLLVACGGSSSAGTTTKSYKVGVSNTLTGNGWREEMICSIKAQAKVSGMVTQVTVANRNGGPTEQIADLRNLISAGVNAIVLNPSDRDALNPVIKDAASKGIVVVAVDQAVSAPEAYVLSNDQVAYGNLGADWLFKQLSGKGNVVEMRGIDGVPADTDRHQGFTAALANYPGIKIVAQTFTKWSLDPAAQQINALFAANQKIDGVWTSGIDATVIDAFQTAHKAFVPTVGADNNKFVGQLVSLKGQGLVGAAVTNPPPVGGAGLAVALDVLQGKSHPKLIKLTPEVWANTTSDGVAKLQSKYDAALDPYYSVQYGVAPYTTYNKAQLVACQS
ncbi:MAG TPA: substrate-binding domain-containing protein [Candidatus Dormibacteraeota bacterium]|nr:substrate-binding domain-containing protein [Candidatus Dormibacteraeota bacterium]